MQPLYFYGEAFNKSATARVTRGKQEEMATLYSWGRLGFIRQVLLGKSSRRRDVVQLLEGERTGSLYIEFAPSNQLPALAG